ncbi:MAG TPA: hypothetical protein VH592_22160 [Gemmataceae bacterium]|jgi:tetratricopeptide (TPR) repeat protein
MTPRQHPAIGSPEEQHSDTGEPVIPLPAAAASEPLAGPQRRRAPDLVLAFLVLVLAFLAASFAARNSDLWFHLATGRLLAEGQFAFGVDPFAYTTQHVYWACHSWLFDLALYVLRGAIGDAGLIVIKALIVMALAGLLMSVRRPTGAAWLPAFFTMLAVLAMGPRLLLQPACISYFLLSLTFWLLWRRTTQASHRLWPLLFVFILWVNVDEWFLLGPLMTALFWLGERLQPPRNSGDVAGRTSGWIVLLGVTVCLINPYTYHAFTLPAELSIIPWTSGLREDVRFRSLFASPWDAEHLHAAMRLNAAVLAYYALTFLGLVSFLLHLPALRDWRLLVWLPFALLASWQARLVPFFAVVAAPVTVLNWQDIVRARYSSPGTRRQFLPGASYLALVVSLLSLILLTWMGWLGGHDREERHVAWEIQEDPSLQQAAQTLNDWHHQGLLPDDEQIFAVAPEATHYDAWFCRGIKDFFDHRYPLFPQAARDYETVCRALLSSPTDSEDQRRADWQKILRDHKVGIVVFYDHDPQRLFAVLQHLTGDTEDWTLLSIAGQALLLGWNKAHPATNFGSLVFDADRLAFGPQDARTQREAPSVPEKGPEQLSARRNFWTRLARPLAGPSWESAAATMYLHYFHDSEAAHSQSKMRLLLFNYAASLIGLAAQPSATTQVLFQLVSSQQMLAPSDFVPNDQLGPYFAPLLERSPSLPLLAIHAARRAVAANPEDANAWLRLGQAYLLLRDYTCEHSSEGQIPPLAQLRHVQIVTALEQAVRLDPKLEAAHHELSYLYGAANALDQSLEHRQAEARLSRQAGPRPGESAAEFTYRIELMDNDHAKLVKLVQNKTKEYDSVFHSLQGDCVAQARMALQLGLARRAVEEILLSSPADLLGAPGIRLELTLLLSLGRVHEVRSILNDEQVRASKHGLGLSEYNWPAYEWLHVLQTAAVGDYGQCREELRAIRVVKHAEHDRLRQQASVFERRNLELLPSLLAASPPFLPAFTIVLLGRVLEERMLLERTVRAQQGVLCLLEGLLALEQGEVDAARAAFTEADELAETTPFAGRAIAVGYLHQLKAYQPAKPDNSQKRR